MRPLLRESMEMEGRAKGQTKSQLRTAEGNLKETIGRYPATKNMFNMRVKEGMVDPFEKEVHKPMRAVGASSPK